MKTGVRRTEISDRLRASCELDEFEQSVEYTVQKYQEWHEKDSTIPIYTADTLVKAMRDCIHQSRPLEQTPLLCWDPKIPKPQLDAGQHRRQAFLDTYNPGGLVKELHPTTYQVRDLSFLRLEQLFNS